MSDLTHLDGDGNLRQVDVSAKAVTARSATARSRIRLPEVCRAALAAGGDTKKGNVLQCARLAGIMASKKTADLIPLCHALPLDGLDFEHELNGNILELRATARCTGRTGVEMEALTAVSVAALTVYDMLKALSHDLVIESTELLRKEGGRSGIVERSP
jgi:cyclic pyranopterin phosphate synthase